MAKKEERNERSRRGEWIGERAGERGPKWHRVGGGNGRAKRSETIVGVVRHLSGQQARNSCERSLLAGSTLALERDHGKNCRSRQQGYTETEAGEEYCYFAFLTGGFFCIASVLRVCWRMVANGDAANDSFLMMAGRRVDSAVLSMEGIDRSEQVNGRA